MSRCARQAGAARRRMLLWVVPSMLWLAFVVWYTDFGGPLSDTEVDEVLAALQQRGLDRERFARFERFLREDSGRQFIMVNNIDMNESPPLMPGFEPGATAEEYNAHYMEHMYPELFARACHPVFLGEGLGVDLDVAGIEGAHGWDLAALFRYKSRRAFAEIITHPDTGARHAYKLAAMTKTIAYPVAPVLYLSDPRLLLFLVLGLVTSLLDMVLYRNRSAVPKRSHA